MRRSTAIALLCFAILSPVLTYPLAFHLGDAVEDRQDALLNVWITAWDGHQLLSDPLHLFDANIFYPYPRTLAYSELLLGNALLSLPITAATDNPVLAYNVALLLSFILSGFGTYLLVRRLTGSSGAGLVAGIIFAFCSYRLTNLAQAQLLTMQWIPFALLALIQLMHHPRARHVASFVLFFSLQALSSFYYGILLALAVAGLVIWELGGRALGMRERNVQDPGFGLRRPSPVVHLLVAAVCSLLVILPFALPYFKVQEEMGFERTLADNEPFSASLQQYLMVPTGSVVHGQWLPSDDTPMAGGYPVDALFPGLVALVLAGWGMVRGDGRLRWFFLFLLLASFLLSLGPRLYLAPAQPAGLRATLPYAWLYAVVPGFKALRAPVRFDGLVTLSLSVLAGYGMACLLGTQRQPGSHEQDKRRPWLLALCVVLLVGESLVWPASKAQPVPVGNDVPPVYRWLAQRLSTPTQTSPILELPMAFTAAGPQLEYQYFSTYHWQTTPDGYSGFIPRKHGQIVYEMERFPWERSVSLLQALDVRQVVIHTRRYPRADWLKIEAALALTDDLLPVETLGTDQVYQVKERRFETAELEVRGYLAPRAAAGQPYAAYLIATNHGARSYAVEPTQEIWATVNWETDKGSISSNVSAGVPLVTSPDGGAAVIPLSLRAPVAPAIYDLTIGERDGPLGRWLLIGTVEVGAQGDDAFPVPARLEGWEVPSMAHPGEPLAVNLTWHALGKIDAYYSIYVKLLDEEGNVLAGWDGQPQDGGAPTLLWVPGETIHDVVVLDIPANSPPGDYAVEVGMYRAKDLARCLTLNADGVPVDRIVLGTVHIGR